MRSSFFAGIIYAFVLKILLKEAEYFLYTIIGNVNHVAKYLKIYFYVFLLFVETFPKGHWSIEVRKGFICYQSVNFLLFKKMK